MRTDNHSLPYSTNQIARNVRPIEGLPPAQFVESVHYVLVHGNGTRPPRLQAALPAMETIPAIAANPKAILNNEDSPVVPNLDASGRNYSSWGYYNRGIHDLTNSGDSHTWDEDKPRWTEKPLEDLCGFQTPHVNWRISTRFRRDFLERVMEVSGMQKT